MCCSVIHKMLKFVLICFLIINFAEIVFSNENITTTTSNVTENVIDYKDLYEKVYSENTRLKKKVKNLLRTLRRRTSHRNDLRSLTSAVTHLIADIEPHVSSPSRDYSDYCGKSTFSAGSTNEWLVIQRRHDGSVDFNRSWTDYQKGFGNESGEFFIGLDRLYMMTAGEPHELLILLEDFENVKRCARYNNFKISNAYEQYKINTLGRYSGNAGDSLSYHKDQKFSTYDRDNDRFQGNCGLKEGGGWWFYICQQSNLNGRYLFGRLANHEHGRGVHWNSFGGNEYSLKFTQMMIRTKN